MNEVTEKRLETVIKGYEPFDLLRISKDAFYDVVAQEFPEIEIFEMNLLFKVVNEEVVIRVELTDYREVI